MTLLCDGGWLGTGKTVVGEDCVVLTLLWLSDPSFLQVTSRPHWSKVGYVITTYIGTNLYFYAHE